MDEEFFSDAKQKLAKKSPTKKNLMSQVNGVVCLCQESLVALKGAPVLSAPRDDARGTSRTEAAAEGAWCPAGNGERRNNSVNQVTSRKAIEENRV